MPEITDLDDYILKTKDLLELEKLAENDQQEALLSGSSLGELCSRGVALNKLHVTSIRTGLGGRKVLTLALKQYDNPPPLPSNKLFTGDMVSISLSTEYRNVLFSGMIMKMGDHELSIACEPTAELPDFVNRTFFVILAPNDVTYRRLNSCLDALKEYDKWPGHALVEYLFGKRRIPSASIEVDDVRFSNENLNEWQKAAVRNGINEQKPIAVIHGPPGTGKTTTIVEIIKQLAERNKKILLCAPSNVAVDNVVSQLVVTVPKVIRLGHPARSNRSLVNYTLDARLTASDQAELIADIRSEIDTTVRDSSLKPREKWQKVGDLRKELKSRERNASESVIRSANVIASTLTTASPYGPLKNLRKDPNFHFDVAIIDECAQSLELACWISMLQAKRVILGGDHCQLPPTILSDKAAHSGLDVTLMDRIHREFIDDGDSQESPLVTLLKLQYRMNSVIMTWASDAMYDGKLLAGDTVKNHCLKDLYPDLEDDLNSPMLMIDTDGCDMNEIFCADDESKGNPDEVYLVYCHVKQMMDNGVRPSDISIISPYNLQVQLMQMHIGSLYPDISIRTIDGFQGQENNVIVISMVRSNSQRVGAVGFLSDTRRLNVAITRARMQVTMVGDSSTTNSHPFLRSLNSYIALNGIVRSAIEYQEELKDVPFAIDTSALSSPATKSAPAADTASLNAQKSKLGPNKNKRNAPATPVKQRSTSNSGPPLPSVSPQKNAEQAEEGEKGWQATFRRKIDKFMHEIHQQRELGFSSDLGPHQRRWLHEYAESVGLEHCSIGEGQERHIILSKKIAAKPIGSLEDEKLADETKEEEPQSSSVNKPLNQQSSLQPQTSHEPTKQKPKKKKPKPRNNKNEKEAEDLDDFDAIVEKYGSEEARCKHSGCKTSINIIGQKCPHCNRVYCLYHCQAESHGCGESARVAARKGFRTIIGGVLPPSHVNKDRREMLEAKMAKKRAELRPQSKKK